MGINKFNSEGYHDPTAHDALVRVVKHEKQARRKKAYICSPFAGDTKQNTANARRYSRFAVNANYDPETPHLFYTQFLNDSNPAERRIGTQLGINRMRYCTELWVFGSTVSSGMAEEIRIAKIHKKIIRYFTEQCVEVKKYDHSSG